MGALKKLYLGVTASRRSLAAWQSQSLLEIATSGKERPPRDDSCFGKEERCGAVEELLRNCHCEPPYFGGVAVSVTA
jgi:hypothetical protein